MKSQEQIILEIQKLEIEASKLVAQADGKILESNLFPKYLKITRKLQKLRSKL